MRYEMSFGVGFDRNNDAIPEHIAAKLVRSCVIEAAKQFGGCTLLDGQGAWIDPHGTLVLEACKVIAIDVQAAEDDKALALAEFIRATLNQSAVHFVKSVSCTREVYAITVVDSPAIPAPVESPWQPECFGL